MLQEFYVQATHPRRETPLTHDQATGLVEAWLRFHVAELSVGLMRAALGTAQRWGISYWDAFAGVQVLNPFA